MVLVEDVDAAALRAPLPADGTRRGRRSGAEAWRTLGRRERWAVGGAGLLAVLTTLGAVVTGADEAARTPPAWLGPWRAANRVLGAVDDLVLLTGDDGTGVQARTASDGAVRWGPEAAGTDCAVLDGPAILCTATTYAAGGPFATALDLDGRLLGSFVPSGSVIALWVVDADLVVLGRDAGHLLATRWSPGSGATVWRYRSTDPVVAPAGYPFSAERVGGELVVGGTRAVVLRLDVGRETPPVRGAGGGPGGT